MTRRKFLFHALAVGFSLVLAATAIAQRRAPGPAPSVSGTGLITEISDRSITISLPREPDPTTPGAAETRTFQLENPLRVTCVMRVAQEGPSRGPRPGTQVLTVDRSYLTVGQRVKITLQRGRAARIDIEGPVPFAGELGGVREDRIQLNVASGGAGESETSREFALDRDTLVLWLHVREIRSDSGQIVRTYRTESASRGDLKEGQQVVVFPGEPAPKVLILTKEAATTQPSQ